MKTDTHAFTGNYREIKNTLYIFVPMNDAAYIRKKTGPVHMEPVKVEVEL